MINYLLLITMSLLSFLLGGCATPDGVESVSAEAFRSAITSESVQLLDVRSAEEYNDAHIDQATNIDVHSRGFMDKVNTTYDKSKKVYVYCHSGNRSMQAASVLAREGYQVVNLNGGISAWVRAGYPVVR